MKAYVFPSGFLWGAATSSYQIEGATKADGRSESVWDRFAAAPGNVVNGATGDPACDHYHRWQEDIGLMRELGLGAYRFSVAWPRVMPGGRVNEVGLDFYDRLVDGLLEAGIEPFVTLYHWDHPQDVEEGGGWRNRDTAYAFAEYAAAVVDRLGDRVTHWLTHNEPWVVAHLGHRTGQHAPGLVDSGEELDVAHHLLLSHGLAVEALRAARRGLKIGIALNLEPRPPRSAHPLDVAAARLEEGLMNRWFLDPLVGKGYPSDTVEQAAWRASVVLDGDMRVISQPLDFVGLNYYRVEIVADPSVSEADRPQSALHPEEVTAMGWPVTPHGMGEMLALLADYGFESIYVTENGAAYTDQVESDGTIRDLDRQRYLDQHLRAAAEAIAAGIPLHGYFVWSLFDNFEWSFGYSRRFGLIHVDFGTQKRTLKQSARWYQQVIAGNGLE